jgi:beta-galactosidase
MSGPPSIPVMSPLQPDLQEPLLLDWTPRNTAPHSESVEVYTNCEDVELLLNGQSLGTSETSPGCQSAHWDVPYAPGSLRAVAYNQGKAIAEDELRTAESPTHIVLSTERTTISPGDDHLATIAATAVDDAGVRVPDSSVEVQFAVSGPAQIVATDNGSNTDHDSFLLPRHHLYGGRGIVLVQATASAGTIRIHASAAGLADGEVDLTVIPPVVQGLVRAF